jgi:hypothetical protein
MKWSLLEIRRLRGHYRLAIADLHHGTGFSRAVQAVFGSGVSGFSSDYAKPQRLKSKKLKLRRHDWNSCPDTGHPHLVGFLDDRARDGDVLYVSLRFALEEKCTP